MTIINTTIIRFVVIILVNIISVDIIITLVAAAVALSRYFFGKYCLNSLNLWHVSLKFCGVAMCY